MTKNFDYVCLCQELRVDVLDSWQEYTLLRLPIHDDPTQAALWFGPSIVNGCEATYVLKITCPDSGKIDVARVPPNLNSARAAATWVNKGIEPVRSTGGKAISIRRRYVPVNVKTPDNSCLWDVHCILDEDY